MMVGMNSLIIVVAIVSCAVANVHIKRTLLSDCLNTAQVPILLSSSTGWADSIRPFNRRFSPISPEVVSIPRTVGEVQAAVKCASQTNTKVSVRSGGHSYAAYGLSGNMVLDLVEFQTVTLDASTNIASVGAGIRLGNMATKLYNLGQRGVPHGTCPGVGIGGHATLGGFGFTSRNWGLTTDVIQSMDVVVANGSLVTASATQNPDLFWALRGAGAGFAVVTEFRLKTYAAPSTNINWAYVYEFSDPTKGAQAFKVAQDFGLSSAPKELGLEILVSPDNLFIITGVYYGTRANFNTLVAPLLAQLKVIHNNEGPVETNVNTYGWIQSLTAIAEGPALNQPVKGYNLSDTFYAKSIEIKESAPLSLSAINGLFDYLYNNSPPSEAFWIVLVELYGGPGSVINSVPSSTDPGSTSSYAHRDSGHIIQFYANTANNLPPWDPEIIDFVNNMVGSLGSEAENLPAYPPYADPEFTQAEAQVRYWGDGVARLKSVKTAVDPSGIIYNPQGF